MVRVSARLVAVGGSREVASLGRDATQVPPSPPQMLQTSHVLPEKQRVRLEEPQPKSLR